MSGIFYKNNLYGAGGSSGGGGGSSTFAGLSDVSLSNLSNGQVPKYNATTQKWENANESSGGGVNYSLTEQVIGTWIDGKPLYQKTFKISLDGVTLNTNIDYNHNVSNIDNVVDFFGASVDTNNESRPLTATSDTYYCYVRRVNRTRIRYYTTFNASGSYLYVTLRYTKTTD